MKKRFSAKAFIITILIHVVATGLLVDASERTYAAWKRTGVAIDSVWPTVMAWVLQPVWMFASHYHFDHPSGAFDYRSPLWFIFPWIVFVAFCIGFLVPRVSGWRSRSSNHAMQRTPTRRSPQVSHD
jgi:hypothetical protein